MTLFWRWISYVNTDLPLIITILKFGDEESHPKETSIRILATKTLKISLLTPGVTNSWI